jgi:hypothetical protein
MVATVIINEHNTTSPTASRTQKTTLSTGTIRFKNADNATVDAVNRMVIPSAGSTGRDYSFEKWIRLEATVAPSVDIQNVEAYSDGASGFGTGVKLWYYTSTAYNTTGGPQAPTTTNDPPHEIKGTTTVNLTNFFTATSAAAVSLNNGSTSYTSTGPFGDWLVLVLEVESSATQGTLTPEVLTFSYDET